MSGAISIVSDPGDGFAAHMRRVNGAIQATPRQMRTAMEQAMTAVLRRVKQHAPVGKRTMDTRGRSAGRGGTLRQKLHYTVPDWNVGTITGGTVYTRIQDRGGKTKAHRIEPRFAKVLAWGAGPGSPFMNAMRFGSGATRGMSAANVSAAFKRVAAGRSVAGIYFHWPKGRGVDHPGSRIRAQEFSSRGFDEAMPTVQRIFANVGKDIVKGGV